MIELFALAFATRQMILLGAGVALLLVLIAFAVVLIMKIMVVRKEQAVESLPTLVDLGLEEDDNDISETPSLEEEESAFYEDDDDDDEMFQSKFLG